MNDHAIDDDILLMIHVRIVYSIIDYLGSVRCLKIGVSNVDRIAEERRCIIVQEFENRKGKKKEKKKRSVNSGILIEAFKYLKKKDECEKVESMGYFFLHI